jgi:SAM-dependent methyltransferase
MLNVDSLDGISTAECRALLPFTFKIRNPATWFRVVLPDLIENLNRRKDLSERLRGASRNLAATVDLRAARKRFVGKLLSEMTGLKLEPEKTPWSRYYEKDAPPEAQEKIDVISQILDRIRPATLFDAGCNTGLFGALASRKAIRTVAVDTDESCVSRLYATARAEGLDILPLVMSVVRYSPASGWMGIEYPSAPERLRCECVLALSLVHHLALGQLQDFERIIRSLGAFTDRYLIVEFVERGDPMAQMLLKRCRHPVDFYSMELFTEVLGRYYRTLEKAPAYSATRTLFVCEK